MKQDQLAKLPFASLITLIGAVLAAVLWHRVPLEVDRPAHEKIEQPGSSVLQDIDVRLWEDPLAAITRYRRTSGQPGNPAPAESAVRKAANLCTAVMSGDAAGENAYLLILGVMVSNAPYADVSEHRSRTRYAVQSALSVAHFVPEDAQHLGVLESDGGIQVPFEVFRRRAGLSKQGHGLDVKILVVWIEEERFARAVDGKATPIQSISRLMERITVPCAKLGTGASPKQGAAKPRRVEVSVIGPTTSDTLRAMVREANERDDRFKAPVTNLAFYSPFATASGIDLLQLHHATVKPCGNKKQDWPAPDWETQYRANPRYSGSILNRYFRGCGLYFFSTIATDEELTEVLVDELKRRDPVGEGTAGENYYVALISELDTYYGRTLPKAFMRAAGQGSKCEDDAAEVLVPGGAGVVATAGPPQGPCRVLRYGYLRGLDGQVPAARDQAGGGKSDNTPEAAARVAARERAEGPKQFDSLRRLSARILDDNERVRAANPKPWLARLGRYSEREIRAIGVLGTDIYDKMAILRALREDFPRAVFFTTDLDARMLDVDQYRWTRNLVVASSFGLQLAPCLQKHIPPFRGVYQTSGYLAARLTLYNAFAGVEVGRGVFCPEYPQDELVPLVASGARSQQDNAVAKEKDDNRGFVTTQITIDQWLATPRLFEIGRTEPLALLDGEGRNERAAGSVHPQGASYVPATSNLVGGVVLTVLAVLALIVFTPAGRVVGEAWHFIVEVLGFERGHWHWRLAVGLLTLVFIVLEALLLCAYLESAARQGEPIRWFEGLSIWPSELIRLFALLLAAIFFFAACARSQENLRWIADKFSMPMGEPPLGVRGWRAFFGQPICDSPGNPGIQGCWRSYVALTSPGRCLVRALTWTATFWIIGVFLMEMLGYPGLPSRGAASAWLDRFVGYVLLPGFLVLLFFVADLTRLCERFSNALARAGEAGRWPDGVLENLLPAIKPSQTDPEDSVRGRVLSAWVDIRLVAERTKAINPLVYFPFIVLALLVIARAGLFDDWDIPVGLIVVLVASFTICCISAGLLQRTASRVRERSIRQLQACLLEREQNDKPGVAPTSAQIKHLIQDVESLREGAFVPLLEQPFIAAGLLPFASAGGLQLVQMLGLVH